MPLTPLDAARDVLERGRALLRLSTTTNLSDLAEDLRRSAFVLAGAAVDTYFHQRVFKEASVAPVTKAAGEITISLREVDHIIETMLESRRKGKNGRPRVILKRNLQERLSKLTFQGVRGIELAADYLAIRSPWSLVSDGLGVTPETAKQRVAQFYRRRNRIAHEGDLVRYQRPRVIKREPLTHDETQSALDLAEATISAFDASDV